MERPQAQLQQCITSVPSLTREDAAVLLGLAAALHSALTVHLLTLGPAAPDNPNQLLPAKEAAKRLGISTRQLYRIAPTLPFTRRDLGGVLFHAGGLSQYIAAQRKDV